MSSFIAVAMANRGPLICRGDQYLASPVVLELDAAVGAGTNLVRRYGGFDQPIANGLDPLIAKILIARIGAARIRRRVDCDLDRPIPLDVGRYLISVVRPRVVGTA